MRSHEYAVARREVTGLLTRPLAVVLGLSAVIWMCRWAGVLPAPLPLLDMDRTVLAHQAEASRSVQDSTLLLVGDSSCLMDVSAPGLERGLGGAERVRNLGTLSFLGPESHGTLVRTCATANPGRVRRVVLLLHPEALRRTASSVYHTRALAACLGRTDVPADGGWGGRAAWWLGLDIMRGRILSRLAPAPLLDDQGRIGTLAQHYGFTWDLWSHMASNRGSATDPRSFSTEVAHGNAEYRLAPGLEVASREFRALLPAGVRLSVGITPVPESFALPGHERRQGELLRQWGVWLRADEVLDQLPAALPDRWFASVTHLNFEGTQHYTAVLARELERLGR
jgi:hypothetical protein